MLNIRYIRPQIGTKNAMYPFWADNMDVCVCEQKWECKNKFPIMLDGDVNQYQYIAYKSF